MMQEFASGFDFRFGQLGTGKLLLHGYFFANPWRIRR